MFAESRFLYGAVMRQDYNDGVDRRNKPDADWKKPAVVELPITRDEIDSILAAENPKAALRKFYRSHVATAPKRPDR